MEPKYSDKVIELLGIFILFCAMLPNKNPYMGHKSYRLDRWIVMNVVKGQSELLKTVLQCFPMFSPHFSIFSYVLPGFPMFLQHFPIFFYVLPCFYNVFPYFSMFSHVLPVFYSILPFNSRSVARLAVHNHDEKVPGFGAGKFFAQKKPGILRLKIHVLGSKLPIFPYNRGWSSTQ